MSLRDFWLLYHLSTENRGKLLHSLIFYSPWTADGPSEMTFQQSNTGIQK